MSGIHNGVQARISALNSKAVFVHCTAHNLNLVLNDTCNGILAIKAFYDIVQKIYVFFSESNVQWSISIFRIIFQPHGTISQIMEQERLHILCAKWSVILQLSIWSLIRKKKKKTCRVATQNVKAEEEKKKRT